MNKINTDTLFDEGYGFKSFSEAELSMILGGGGEEQFLDFLQEELTAENKE